MLRRTPVIPKPTNPPYIGSWGVFEGFEFDTVYTDGSWKESCSLREFLGGISDNKAGGAIVLEKGDKFLCIRIEMDVETESAFDTEMIFLLIAIDICVDKDVTIYSDCKSALALLNGHNKGSFFNILSGWTKPLGCILNKVKAHPEKYKLPKDWQPEDKGIWIADQIAGGLFAASKKIAASIWLKRVSFTSKATIVDRNGVPFFKDISRRWSKHNLKMYLEGRD